MRSLIFIRILLYSFLTKNVEIYMRAELMKNLIHIKTASEFHPRQFL